jgi:predicted ester cyclase
MTVVVTARTTIDSYLEALTTGGDFASYLTDDVIIELIGTDQVVQGRSAVADFITYAHQTAFASTVDVISISVDESSERAALELVFRGSHTGEFAGIAPTGREVRVPYSVHYDLTAEGISAIRVYALAQALVSALS